MIFGLKKAKSLTIVARAEMSTDRRKPPREDVPDDLEDLLPESSVLTLDEYVEMHAAVGHRTRYEILYRLVHGGDMSPKQLEEALDIDDSTLHYHLNKLVDVGLVEKRQRTERDRDGLYTYYRATVFGRVTLTDGVDELIQGEQAFDSLYDSSNDS